MSLRIRSVATLCATAALAVGALGCGAEQVPPEISIIDHTGSSVSGSTDLCADSLLAYARGRFGPVDGKRGTLRTGLFDARTAANPTFPVSVTFEVPAKDQSSPNKTKQRLDDQLTTLEADVERLLREAGQPEGGTDLVTMLASLGDAARGLGATRVWICSDAVDNRLTQPITQEQVERVVDRLEQRRALPDLGGIAVVFDTSSIRGRAGITAAEVAALHKFVEQLVTRSGGRLVAYGPGAGAGGTAGL